MSTRILLVDDHEIVRRGIHSLLDAEPGFVVCAEAGDGREAVELARRHKPDVVVMDIGMPGMNGIEATRLIRRTCRRTEVLALSLHDSEHYAREMLDAGARGYLLKSDAVREVVAAVRAVSSRHRYMTAHLDTKTTTQESSGKPALTRRETQVLQLVAQGRTSREISRMLGVTLKTIESHRANLMRKLPARSVAELMRYAIQKGLIAK
jgi:DNA-binding NarL/FixJ family response regulator